MKEQIKGLRVKVDGVAQLCKELKPFEHKNIPIEQAFSGTGELIRAVYLKTNSKEIEKAVDSLYLGKAWLGKLLGELGKTINGECVKTNLEKTIKEQEIIIDFLFKAIKEGK